MENKNKWNEVLSNNKNTPVVSGANVTAYTEEAMAEKRLTISSLVERMSAEMVVGDIVDEYEEQRKRTVEEKKEIVRKEQDSVEAAKRQKIEEEKVAGAINEAEEGKRKSSDSENSLSVVVAGLSHRVKTEFFKKGVVKRLLKAEDISKEGKSEQESVGTQEASIIPSRKEYKSRFRKRTKNLEKQGQALAGEDISLSETELLDSEAEITEVAGISTLEYAGSRKEIATMGESAGKGHAADFAFRVQKQKEQKLQKKNKHKQRPADRKISITVSEEEIIDEVIEEPLFSQEQEISNKAESLEERRQKEILRRSTMQEDISRFHEPVCNDEVYRFRNALERLSSDSYRSVSVYAACIIDREFKSLSIIRNVSLLAELIEESGDDMDFYFAYILTNKGVQHYGNDEALSDVSLAMEEVRALFIQKKGRVTVKQIQQIPALRIFQTIYYEDRR